jgi:hypothetical protein
MVEIQRVFSADLVERLLEEFKIQVGDIIL